MSTALDLEIFVEYGFVELTGEPRLADLTLARKGQKNGICGAQVPGHLSMITGTHTGRVQFRVELHDTAPAVDDRWEDVVEVSVEIPSTMMRLASFDDSYEVAGLRPGWCRARYCAEGMDKARSEVGIPSDAYLLALWPAPFAKEVVLRQESSTSLYWAGVANGTEREFAARAREEEPSLEGIDPAVWGGELPTRELLDAGAHAHELAEIDRRLADALVVMSESGHRAVLAWVCARMAPQARAIPGVDWPTLARAVASGLGVSEPFDDRSAVDMMMFGPDADGFPNIPEGPAPKDLLAAWTILDPLTLPEDRSVKEVMRALTRGYRADESPEEYVKSARALIDTLT